MRRYPTDKPLWAIFALAVFVALGFVDVVGEGDNCLWHHAQTLVAGKWASPSDGAVAVGFWAIVLAVPAVIIGWLLHAVAVMCGVRLARRADLQTADYDDGPPASPTP